MFHRKIEKIQSDIDQMLDLFAEADNTPENEYEQLGVMILMAQEGDLDKRGYRKLEKRLSEDSHSLRYYVDFQFPTAMLYQEYANGHIRKMMDTILNHAAAHSV